MKFQILAGAALLALGILFINPVHAQTMGAAVPAGQGLWTSNPFHQFISELVAKQYQRSGIPARALNTGPSLVGTPGKVAFDDVGDIWIPFCPSDPQLNPALIVAIAPAALKSVAHNRFKGVGVAAEITVPDVRCPTAAVFDQVGNLWISNSARGATPAIIEYSAAELFSTGVQPAVVLTSDAFKNLQGLSFDAQGDLWIADNEASVSEFTPGQLASSGSPTPQLILASTFLEPQDVAFDESGNLWVAYLQGPPLDPMMPNNLSNGAVVKFALADLVGSGTIAPAPAVTFSGPVLCSPLDLCNPYSEAFDTSGDLWVSAGITMFEYSPQQQLTGGSPLATVTLATNLFTAKGESGDVRALNFAGNGFITFGPGIK
jgi:hypothetical protein